MNRIAVAKNKSGTLNVYVKEPLAEKYKVRGNEYSFVGDVFLDADSLAGRVENFSREVSDEQCEAILDITYDTASIVNLHRSYHFSNILVLATLFKDHAYDAIEDSRMLPVERDSKSRLIGSLGSTKPKRKQPVRIHDNAVPTGEVNCNTFNKITMKNYLLKNENSSGQFCLSKTIFLDIASNGNVIQNKKLRVSCG